MHTTSSPPQKTLTSLIRSMNGNSPELQENTGKCHLGFVVLYRFSQDALTVAKEKRRQRNRCLKPFLLHFSLPPSSDPPVVTIGDLSCLCSLKFLHFQHKLTDPVKAATGTFTVPPGWASLHGCHGLQFPPGCQISQGSHFPTFSSALYELKGLGALRVDRDGEAG